MTNEMQNNLNALKQTLEGDKQYVSNEEHKAWLETKINEIDNITTDEEAEEWLNNLYEEARLIHNEHEYDGEKGVTYEEHIKDTREGFHWHEHADFEHMDLNKMFKIFKEYKEKAPFEKMVEVIPFKDSLSWMEDVCYMFSSIFNWEDIPADYDVALDTKANDFLRKMYPYTDEFIFISIKSIKNFVNVYHKIMPMERKRELCEELVNRLITTEGDLKNYTKSYNILQQLNREGVEDLIDKYKFIAMIDDRPIDQLLSEI